MRFHSVSFRDRFSAVEMVAEEEKEIFCSRSFPCCTRTSPNREHVSSWHHWKANSSTALIFFQGKGWEVFAFPSCRAKSRSFTFMQKKEDTAANTPGQPVSHGRVLGCDMEGSHPICALSRAEPSPSPLLCGALEQVRLIWGWKKKKVS